MTQAEYIALLLDLVSRRIITPGEMDDLLDRFDAGELADLPNPTMPETSDDEWLLLVAALWALDGSRPALGQRQRTRDALRKAWRTESSGAVGNVATWQRNTWQRLRTYIESQWIAGTGTDAKPNEPVQTLLDEQRAFLYRFAGELHTLTAVGRPPTPEHVERRTLLYGGMAWAAWFLGNEAQVEVGYVYYYEPRDDRGTCRACSAARGYYLPGQGPMPGAICFGGWACRCRRYAVYNPAMYRQLGGI